MGGTFLRMPVRSDSVAASSSNQSLTRSRQNLQDSESRLGNVNAVIHYMFLVRSLLHFTADFHKFWSADTIFVQSVKRNLRGLSQLVKCLRQAQVPTVQVSQGS